MHNTQVFKHTSVDINSVDLHLNSTTKVNVMHNTQVFRYTYVDMTKVCLNTTTEIVRQIFRYKYVDMTNVGDATQQYLEGFDTHRCRQTQYCDSYLSLTASLGSRKCYICIRHLVVVVVAFSSLERILGECLTIHFPPALFVCLFVKTRLACAHRFHSLCQVQSTVA